MMLHEGHVFEGGCVDDDVGLRLGEQRVNSVWIGDVAEVRQYL
jgi:hypothetical protein